jgi:hypothetical protein
MVYRLFLLLAVAYAQTSCLTSLNSLSLREAVVNVSESREYHLCPNTEYFVGTLDYDYNVVNGQEMLPLRKNLHVKCGTDGSRDNECVIVGGGVQVDGTHLFGVKEDVLENVTIEGITFEGAEKHMAWITRPGKVTFRDCVFRSGRTTPAVLLDYFDPSHSHLELSVTFEDCLFDDNIYPGPPAQPAVVVANGLQNRLIFHKTMFSNNDMVSNNTIVRTGILHLLERG